MTEPLSTTELDAIRARADAATPGPWSARNRSSDGIEDAFLGFEIDGPPDATRGQFARRADAEFMAHARTDIPALLEHIEAQTREIAALKELRKRVDEAEIALLSDNNAESIPTSVVRSNFAHIWHGQADHD